MSDETQKIDGSSGDDDGMDRWTVFRWIAVAVMVLAALAYLVAVPLGVIPHVDRLATAEVVLGVALMRLSRPAWNFGDDGPGVIVT